MESEDGDIRQFIIEEKDQKLVLVEVNGDAQTETPTVNDLCRFCSRNLRRNGVLTQSTLIFARSTLHPRSISDRLTDLGLVLANNKTKSKRLCKGCFRAMVRVEREFAVFRKWKEMEGTPALPGATPEVSLEASPEASPESHKRDRSPSPELPKVQKKLRHYPSYPPTRRSVTQVITTYANRSVVKVPSEREAGIIQNIANENWKTAANLLSTHQDLFEEIKTKVLVSISEQCQKLINPKNGFMLWKTSPDDLKAFSFDNLISELERMAPFLLSIFTTVSKHNPDAACAALCIALRGRLTQMAAFAYHVNNIIARGGIKKEVFNTLSRMAITTSYSFAKAKKREMEETGGAADGETQPKDELSFEVIVKTEEEMDNTEDTEETETEAKELENLLAPIEQLEPPT